MDFSRIVLIALLLFFIFFSPEGQRATSDQERELRALLQQQRDALEVLNRSHFGDFSPPTGRWLNVTALRKDDAYAWEVLLLGKERARSQTNDIFEQALIDAPGKSSEGSVAAVTSFEGVDANAVDREDEVYEASGRRALPFYQNVTGIVHGRWERSRSALPQQSASNLTHLSPKVRATADHGRNITGSRGEMFVRLDERKSEVYHDGLDWVRDIKAEITVQEEGAFGDGWEMILHGVHFPDSGAIVLSTTSDKFAGIYALPHFVWSRRQFKLTQKLLNRTLSKGLQKQEKSDSIDSFPFSSPNRPADSLFPTPSCEFIAYLQQHPVQLSSSKVRLFGSLDDLEGELRTPIGAPKESVPNLRFSLVMMSPDCGFVLDSTNPSDHGAHFSHLTGVKSEVQFEQIRHLLEVFSLVVAAQIYLLIRQMKDASTPSTRSRVSYYTIAMMALGDGFVFLTFMALSLFMDAVYLTIAAFSFLSFLSVSFFGMKFLMDVWSVQAPERITSANSRRQGTVSAAQPSSASPGFNDTRQRPVGTALPRPESGSLPLPVTAANAQEIGAPPVLILPPDQDVEADAAEIEATARGPQGVNAQATTGSARREMGTMYSKFYFLLIGLLFLSLNATSWPAALRTTYARVLATCYLSFWWPQIRRNALRNCRRALRWEFVLGQSALRLIPFAYFTLVPDNVFYLPSDHPTSAFLAAWLWLQILILASQETLGPRFFVPQGWAPPAYDYHPILREDDEEAVIVGGSKTGHSEPSSPVLEGATSTAEHGKRLFDCAICMQAFEVSVVPRSRREHEGASSGLGAGLFGRRAYMVTPCRHVFHSACLDAWMRYKLQCPICRENLPPV